MSGSVLTGLGSVLTSAGASGDGGGILDASSVLQRAQALLPNGNLSKVLGMGDFDTNALYRTTLSTSGTITPSTTTRGGVINMSSTGTANRTAVVSPAGVLSLIGNPRTEYWYYTWRKKITSAIDVQTSIDGRLCAPVAGAPQILFGISGGDSTAFFSYLIQNDAGVITARGATTAPFNSIYNIFEMYNDTALIHFRLNGLELLTSPSTNYGTNPVVPALVTANGTTATARTSEADYAYLCVPNAA